MPIDVRACKRDDRDNAKALSMAFTESESWSAVYLVQNLISELGNAVYIVGCTIF